MGNRYAKSGDKILINCNIFNKTNFIFVSFLISKYWRLNMARIRRIVMPKNTQTKLLKEKTSFMIK